MDIMDHAQDLAKKLANNHHEFDSFVWFDKPEDSQNWALIYTSTRDSGLMAISNESVINKVLQPFSEGDSPDVVFERHNHWACGYTDGFSIRVYKDDKITKAFVEYCKLHLAMQDYPVLDSDDYSQREYNAAIEAIESESPVLVDPPEDWSAKVFGWLYEFEQRELENEDDNGAYPSKESICQALDSLQINYEK